MTATGAIGLATLVNSGAVPVDFGLSAACKAIEARNGALNAIVRRRRLHASSVCGIRRAAC